MKLVVVVILSILAFTASLRLPHYKDLSVDGGANDEGPNEEGGKRNVNPRSSCQADNEGKPKCSNPGYCSVAGDACDTFYSCTASNSTDLILETCKCDSGYIFSEGDPDNPCILGSCDNGTFVVQYESFEAEKPYTCTTKPGDNSTAAPPTESPFQCQELGTFPDPHNCSLYYKCVSDLSGKITLNHTACGPGQYFNADDLMCEEGSCDSTGPSHFDCPSLGVFPDPGDCYKYYVCTASLDGTITLSGPKKCNAGMYFDPEFGACVYGDC